MSFSDWFSLLSFLVAGTAAYISWRAFRRSSDAHVMNVAFEVYTPKDYPATPFDHETPYFIIRNRSLFTIEIEDVGIVVNGQKLPCLIDLLPQGNPELPFTLNAKEALHLVVPDEDFEAAVGNRFEVYLKTGCGQIFSPSSDDLARLDTYIQSKLREQVELRKKL